MSKLVTPLPRMLSTYRCERDGSCDLYAT